MSNSSELDREEGEIIDDEFEAISDNSMILSFNDKGKSLYRKEHLPVISLSSVSEEEDHREIINRKSKKFKHHHRHHHHNHNCKRKMKEKYFGKCHKKKKWKRLMVGSSSSSSESDGICSKLGKHLKTQLKAAIRYEAGDSHKNSLKARLKAMTKVDNNMEVEKVIEIKSDNNAVEEQRALSKESSEEVDNELIELRLEALRTAVLNKSEHRKKKKFKELMEQKDISMRENLETNKENTINKNENSTQNKQCIDNLDVNTTPPDEDEDVLRALLLASMSKNMTKDVNSKELPKQIHTKSTLNNLRPIIVRKTVMPLKQHIPHKIQPIIINVDSDSESDNEKVTKSDIPPDKPNKVNSEIENTVEKFLREQRAKVEAQNVHKLVAPKGPPATTPKPNKIEMRNIDKSVILEKSSVKLLPKVKQLEYQKLLQKLKNAQKKPRVRKSSFKGVDETNLTNPSRKLLKIRCNGPDKPPEINRVVDLKQDARRLHIALKQMQKQQDGRLQIEEKYVVLTPMIRKINEATTERKKYDQEVKRLMGELAEAKRKLQDTHRNFSECVKNLLVKKEELDKRPPPELKKFNGNAKFPITSTPIKVKLSTDVLKSTKVLNISGNTPQTSNISSKLPPNFESLMPYDATLSTNNLEKNTANSKDAIFKVDPENAESLANDLEKMLVDGVDKLQSKAVNRVDDEINPGDPNDIDRIYEKHILVPEYISPLDCVKRSITYDPFLIMCPYDVDGNCRDPECTYKHYTH